MKLKLIHFPAITALFQWAASGSPTLTCAQPFGRGAATLLSKPQSNNIFRFAPLMFAVVLLMLPLPAYADWQAWLESNDCTEGLPGIITEVADSTGIDPVDLAALSMQESSCKHYRDDGTVTRGDWTGKTHLAIGIMQIHRSPWVKHWRKLLDDDTLTRYDMADNVLMAAHILLYSGYETDRIRSFARYNGSSKNPNYRYARSVDKFAVQARNYQEAE